jgi:hypothetical protein
LIIDKKYSPAWQFGSAAKSHRPRSREAAAVGHHVCLLQCGPAITNAPGKQSITRRLKLLGQNLGEILLFAGTAICFVIAVMLFAN